MVVTQKYLRSDQGHLAPCLPDKLLLHLSQGFCVGLGVVPVDDADPEAGAPPDGDGGGGGGDGGEEEMEEEDDASVVPVPTEDEETEGSETDGLGGDGLSTLTDDGVTCLVLPLGLALLVGALSPAGAVDPSESSESEASASGAVIAIPQVFS